MDFPFPLRWARRGQVRQGREGDEGRCAGGRDGVAKIDCDWTPFVWLLHWSTRLCVPLRSRCPTRQCATTAMPHRDMFSLAAWRCVPMPTACFSVSFVSDLSVCVCVSLCVCLLCSAVPCALVWSAPLFGPEHPRRPKQTRTGTRTKTNTRAQNTAKGQAAVGAASSSISAAAASPVQWPASLCSAGAGSARSVPRGEQRLRRDTCTETGTNTRAENTAEKCKLKPSKIQPACLLLFPCFCFVVGLFVAS